MQKIREFLFGKWEFERVTQAIGEFTLFGHDFEEDITIIVERNVRTGQRRAYSEDLQGVRRPHSLAMLEQQGFA